MVAVNIGDLLIWNCWFNNIYDNYKYQYKHFIFFYDMNQDDIKKHVIGFDYEGTPFRLAHYWWQTLSVDDYLQKPLNYLEIGVYQGLNLISVANSYGLHPDSKLIGIDPWTDYDEYPEYKDKQTNNFSIFTSKFIKHRIKIKSLTNVDFLILKFQN